MPFDSKDIGGGLQAVQFEQGKPTENSQLQQAQQYLGLVELGQRIQQNPVELAAKQADLKLKENELLQVDDRNAKLQWELKHAKNTEIRAQEANFFNAVKDLPELYRKAPQLANMRAQQIGFSVEQTEGGKVALVRAGDRGHTTAIVFNPRGITDPKDAIENERALNKDFERYADTIGWSDIDTNYNNILRLKDSLDPGAAMSQIISYAKVKDPGSVVRTSEGDAIANTGGLPASVQVMIQTIKGGGKLTKTQRDFLLKDAKGIYDLKRDDLAARAQHYVDMSERLSLDPRNVVTSRGTYAYDWNSKYPSNTPPTPDGQMPAGEARTDLTSQPGEQKKTTAKPIGAGYGAGEKAPKAPPKKSALEIMDTQLLNLGMPGKK